LRGEVLGEVFLDEKVFERLLRGVYRLDDDGERDLSLRELV
jgi:hypothetical protein